MMDFITGIISGIISTIIAGLIAIFVSPLKRKFKEFWKSYNLSKKTGLKMFLPLKDFLLFRIFEKMIEKGDANTEIFIIGRTIRWLIEKEQNMVIKGLEKGINFKVLILNPYKVKNNTIDLTPLQLNKDAVIDRDLEEAVQSFDSICKKAKEKKYKGSFEVKLCDFVIFNSLISFTNKDERNIILDFSFSEETIDKYQQYYEYKPDDNSQFCNKLYKFYKGFFEQSQFYIKYKDKKIYHIEDFIKEDVDTLLKDYSESEEIRNNKLENFLFIIPKVFNSIKNNSTPPFPISIQLEVTNICNTKCSHCKRHEWPQKKEMSIEQIKSLFDEFAKLQIQSITLSGGEPTLREDFIDILQYAKDKKLSLGVLTNGLEITPDLAEPLTKYSDWIRISIDGSNEDTYKEIRKGGNLEKVKDSISHLKKAIKNTNCKIGICYSIQRSNIDDVPHMIKFVEELDLPTKERVLTFKFVHGKNGFLCDLQQLQNFREKILSENKNDNKIANLQYLSKFLESYSNIDDVRRGEPLSSYYKNNKIRCFTPYLFSLIDAFGDIYPCCFLYYDNDAFNEQVTAKRTKYKIGNILENNSFEKIWLNTKYTETRKSLSVVDVDQFPECKECLRHYLHNIFLTQLFKKYEYYINEMDHKGKDIFNDILNKYPLQKVWL